MRSHVRRDLAILLALVLLVLFGGPGARAQSGAEGTWVHLGDIRVHAQGGKDALSLDPAAAHYKAIRMQAVGGPVVLTRVQVAWSDGDVHTEDRTINLRPGERTRPIAPADRGRRLDRIGVLYQPGGPVQRPVILQAWGLRASSVENARERPAPGAAPATGQQWIVVGSRSGRFLGFERETISIKPESGELGHLRIDVKDRSITLRSVSVVYADGEVETIAARTRVEAGGSYGPIALKPKLVKEVTLEYRSRILDKSAKGAEQSRIELAAQTKAAPPTTVEKVTTRGRPATAAGDSDPDCVAKAVCTPVPVFFGTNRARKDGAERFDFTQDRAEGVTLGRTIVTVPRAYRRKGEITRPSWWDLLKGKSPWTEDPARHFALLPGGTMIYGDEAAFLAAVKAHAQSAGEFRDHAFVFVHGYNTSFEHALYRTAQIAYDLGTEDVPFGTAFLYSWPSAGEAESYIYDLESVQRVGTHLKRFVQMVLDRSGAKHVHLIAHSMGNAALLPVLAQLAQETTGGAKPVSEIILAAPDVDQKDFAQIAAQILPLARSLTLYASSNDRAIQLSRKARRDLARAGDVIGGTPVIVAGLDSIDVSAVSTAIFALNHSTYADKKELLNDIRRLMLTGQRPPHTRDLAFKRIVQGNAVFWRYSE